MAAKSVPNESRHQRIGTDLATPVAMDSGIERSAVWQNVSRIEVFAGAEGAAGAILQTDLHLPPQDEDPLWCAGAVKTAAKPDRAFAQLKFTAGQRH